MTASTHSIRSVRTRHQGDHRPAPRLGRVGSAPYSPAAEGDALFIVDDDLPLLGAPQIQDTMKVPQ